MVLQYTPFASFFSSGKILSNVFCLQRNTGKGTIKVRFFDIIIARQSPNGNREVIGAIAKQSVNEKFNS